MSKQKWIKWKDVPEEARNLLKSAANSIWQQIGDDLFYNERGERDYSITFTWEDLMDVCGDRLYDAGKFGDAGTQLDEDEILACAEYFVNLDHNDRNEYGPFLFPCELYGH